MSKPNAHIEDNKNMGTKVWHKDVYFSMTSSSNLQRNGDIPNWIRRPKNYITKLQPPMENEDLPNLRNTEPSFPVAPLRKTLLIYCK